MACVPLTLCSCVYTDNKCIKVEKIEETPDEEN